jgi:hypothetical protein
MLPAYCPSVGTAVELHLTTLQHPSELYTPYHQSTKLPGARYYNIAELNWSELLCKLNANILPFELSLVPSYRYEVPVQTYQRQSPNKIHELHPRSLALGRAMIQQQLCSDEITALEEEETRIDAEMEEVRRMRELRDQKLAVQQKLREAKGQPMSCSSR